MNHKILIRRSK